MTVGLLSMSMWRSPSPVQSGRCDSSLFFTVSHCFSLFFHRFHCFPLSFTVLFTYFHCFSLTQHQWPPTVTPPGKVRLTSGAIELLLFDEMRELIAEDREVLAAHWKADPAPAWGGTVWLESETGGTVLPLLNNTEYAAVLALIASIDATIKATGEEQASLVGQYGSDTVARLDKGAILHLKVMNLAL